MALTTEELEQIRVVVRSEMQHSRGNGSRGFLIACGIIAAIFLLVIALHVLVIGGFTIYHLMNLSS
jgi:hypothetical protein